MVREFRNDNGITYQIIAENKELDRTLLCEWTKEGNPLYIVAWGINYQRHYWAQGHYFLEDFKAACDYLNGEENKTVSPDHYVSIKDFIRTLSKIPKSQSTTHLRVNGWLDVITHMTPLAFGIGVAFLMTCLLKMLNFIMTPMKEMVFGLTLLLTLVTKTKESSKNHSLMFPESHNSVYISSYLKGDDCM